MTASWSRRLATSCSTVPILLLHKRILALKAADRSGYTDEGPAPLWRRPLRVVSARVAWPCCAGGSG
jgi:hypothetical protein